MTHPIAFSNQSVPNFTPPALPLGNQTMYSDRFSPHLPEDVARGEEAFHNLRMQREQSENPAYQVGVALRRLLNYFRNFDPLRFQGAEAADAGQAQKPKFLDVLKSSLSPDFSQEEVKDIMEAAKKITEEGRQIIRLCANLKAQKNTGDPYLFYPSPDKSNSKLGMGGFKNYVASTYSPQAQAVFATNVHSNPLIELKVGKEA